MLKLFGGRTKNNAVPVERTADTAALAEFDAIRRTQVMLTLAPDGRIRAVNDRFCEVTGYRPADVLGQHHDMIVRPKDRDSAETKAIFERVAQKETVNGIHPRLGRDGDEVWLDMTYAPVSDAAGRLDRILVVARHITEYHLSRRDNRSHVDAIRRAMAVIEFDLDGMILWANDHFLDTVGYRLDEIKGQHHRIFVDPETRASADYAELWRDLARGAYRSGEVKRLTRSGAACWLQATYATVIDPEDRPFKVVKYAFDITKAKNLAADAFGQIDAIQKVLAVIEFDIEGNVLTANKIFCTLMGYELPEIQGRPHSLFVDRTHAASAEYSAFWDELRAGHESHGNFVRFGKRGKQVWLRANYRPIFDADGKVCKVVKFAMDTSIFQVAARVMQEGLERAAGGDLTVQLSQDLGDLDGIRQSFNAAISTMRDVIDGVVARSASLQHETGEITTATTNLAMRTERQATTLADAAAAVEELTASVKSAAELAIGAREMVGEARAFAARSSDVVGKAVTAMDEIAESSKKISTITGLIEEIAFQTNLLALNAGVEAARAGEAGRGFSALISESTQQVGRGVNMVGQAGEALRAIDTSVNVIHERVSDIATSAQEQATALGEVSAAINNLDQTTQQNAAMAEETNAATQSLMSGISEMREEVAYFQQDGRPSGPRRHRAA